MVQSSFSVFILRHLLIAVVAIVSFVPSAVHAQRRVPANAEELELGRLIYQEGRLSSGAEVVASRVGRAPLRGLETACINCHRASGMGQVEANVPVQPITGNFLFAMRSERRLATMDPHVGKNFNQSHDPYTEATLAAAINTGVNNQGRTMHVAMPRFSFSAPELMALTAYLSQLSANWSPGVTDKNIHFATVITPDVDPVRRKAMTDMLQRIFRQKNGSTVTPNQGRTRHHMVSAAEMILGTERNWSLDIWALEGAPESWAQQLRDRYRAKPVFALVSGISDSTWQPVHDFCDQEKVPCWFPTVPVPGKSYSPYAFYFSGGVALEAAVLGQHLLQQKVRAGRVVQIYRDGEVGHVASQTLRQMVEGKGIAVTDHILSADLPAVDALRHALQNTDPSDAIAFWLRYEDVLALGQIMPVAARSFFSATLAKGERAPLSAQWRANASLLYPYELPVNRPKNLDYFYSWLNSGKMALIDEAMQSEVFFSLNFMTDTLAEMLDNIYRDYLVERAETMIGVREGVKSEQETRDRVFLGRVGELVVKHGAMTMDASVRIPITNHQGSSVKSHGTTPYPRLGLAPNQRFASKGAYIVRFAHDTGEQLVADSDWIVP